MKAFFVCLLFTFISGSSGQEPLINLPHTLVAYSGIKTPIHLSYPGIPTGKTAIKAGKACQIDYDSSKKIYMLTPHTGNDSCSIIVGAMKGKQIRWKDTLYIPVRKLPKGEARLGNLVTGSYTMKEIMEQTILTYHNDAYLSDLDWVFITKFHVIIMPKRGQMEDFNIIGPELSPALRTAISKCSLGDLLVIEGIRAANIPGRTDMPLDPITYTFRENYNNYTIGSSYRKFRREGYLLINGTQKHYVYPFEEHQEPADLEKCIKDSIWRYYTYNDLKKNFILTVKDSFKQGSLICSEYYDDSTGRLHYRLKPLNDTSFTYISFHPNGKVHQQGIVLKDEECKEYHKHLFYQYDEYPADNDSVEKIMDDIPYNLYPVYEWKSYDSLGRLSLMVNYTVYYDGSYTEGCGTDPDYPSMCSTKHFRIIPIGDAIFYLPDERIEKKINFKAVKER